MRMKSPAYQLGVETAARYGSQPPHGWDLWRAHAKELAAASVTVDGIEDFIDGFCDGMCSKPPVFLD